MKKFLFCIGTIIFLNNVFGNPVMPLMACISEFKFEQNNTWTLEIAFGTSFRHADYDSIYLCSLSGSERVKLDYLRDGNWMFVITSDSLTAPLTISHTGDCIKLISYTHWHYYNFIDSLPFGNYPGSVIDSLPEGYSICALSYHNNNVCKDKSPTIGFPNDTNGTCGSLTGFLYNNDGTKIIKGYFFLDNGFSFDITGRYFTRMYARHLARSWLEANSLTKTIDTLYVNMNPDSIIQMDIHFKDHVDDVKRQNVQRNLELQIMNYPNPFNSSTNFYIRIPEGIQYRKGEIAIYSVAGKKIYSIPLTKNPIAKWYGQNGAGMIVSSGVYYYRLLLDNTVYANGSMIFLK